MAEVAAGALAEDGGSSRSSRGPRVELLLIPAIVLVVALAYVWWRQAAELDSVEQSTLGWAAMLKQIGQHLRLTAVSAVVVVLIGVPLGVLVTRKRFRALAPVVVGVANAGQAIPGIGLFVLLFLWLGSKSWFVELPFETGFDISILALVLYALLPVLRNTIVGLRGVDPTLIEAGRGVGMSAGAVLRRVELPLALPVITSGVRTALVLLVGTAALASFVGGGGLGSPITAGINLSRYSVMVWSAVIVALVALMVEWLGRLIELYVRPKGI